ncbi:hypothetical protein Corgl_1672 [Coriobacterium glomerans PW2]|uniref:Uncharacterized protein n=1 Tax=Coriobacterium glomerans (strain ATCC 49209 / DSM 20642 / JCM 10262 / PW2) TaxID=700015 RepID=F2NB19_CORGP|nr:right-handed parallel beta-helix repeat-containing protein [Coriobacterium glomerans]AEB07770.1 hypothetical protein Corgl_1672 [Coriobacterium glomerans PW2]
MVQHQDLTIPAEASGGASLATSAFQEAFDRARETGPARVVVPAGTYRIGSVLMHGDTELHLRAGAQILGSEDIDDYTDWDISTTLRYVDDPDIARIQGLCEHYARALITVADARNVAITGEPGSKIDGVDCFDPNGEEGFRGAMGIRICRCEGVRLSGYQFVNAANWSHQIDSCTDVRIEDVAVRGGHDGFNVHHCDNVIIRRCDLRCGDDCVAGFDARNVLIEDCLLNTACNALRLGCANLLVEHCRFSGPGEYPHILEGTYHMHAAVKYYSIKGDVIREDACNWLIRDCTFERPGRLINYDYGSAKGYQTERPLLNVRFEDIRVIGASQPSFFRGTEEEPGSLEFTRAKIVFDPDADHIGEPFVQIGERAVLKCNQVDYAAAGDEPFSGPRIVRADEVAATTLRCAPDDEMHRAK